MKLRVQRGDGSIETISIVGPVEIDEGRTMAHIHSAEGLDHYFTFDGHYDGWGMACNIPIPEGPAPMEGEVKDLIDRVEKDREIEP
jgi:hypothetical protein